MSPPASRVASWFVSSLVVGWLIGYNILRFGGRSPRQAAPLSVLLGIGIGVVIFGVFVFAWRRLVMSGRVHLHHIEEIPPPERLDSRQKTALDLLWPAVGVFALFALVVGALLTVSWLQTEGSRSTTRIVLGAWDVLVGVWLITETAELRRFHGEAVESIGLAALLTAVLAGVAFSLGMYDAAQVALIVVAGAVGALSSFTWWRMLGSRGIPYGVVFALAVAAMSIVFPMVF